LRTLVLSTDAAHSLADAFGTPVGADPTEVATNLYVEQVDAQLRFEQSWADIQRYLLSVLDVAGMDPVAAEELTVIPGAEEVLALLELRLRARSGEWDLIVVDCAPTAETLRLLSLPEALGWYMARVFPMQRRLVKTLKPVLTRAAGVPMPGDSVFDAMQRLHDELLEVRDLLSGPEASVRLVLTPETVVVAEARRSYTTLSLYGYRVDGVVANRIFPADGADAWRAGWVSAQDSVLADVDASFPGLPVWRSVYRPHEPVGVPALEQLAREVYATAGPAGPFAPPRGEGPFRVARTARGAVAHLALPGASKDEVHLARNGDDLVLTVGSYRRLLTLPQSLARLRIAGARVEAGELRVRFVEGSDGHRGNHGDVGGDRQEEGQ
jgi:arsenite-transporting ATPase